MESGELLEAVVSTIDNRAIAPAVTLPFPANFIAPIGKVDCIKMQGQSQERALPTFGILHCLCLYRFRTG